jgi:hypothetical protein
MNQINILEHLIIQLPSNLRESYGENEMFEIHSVYHNILETKVRILSCFSTIVEKLWCSHISNFRDLNTLEKEWTDEERDEYMQKLKTHDSLMGFSDIDVDVDVDIDIDFDVAENLITDNEENKVNQVTQIDLDGEDVLPELRRSERQRMSRGNAGGPDNEGRNGSDRRYRDSDDNEVENRIGVRGGDRDENGGGNEVEDNIVEKKREYGDNNESGNEHEDRNENCDMTEEKDNDSDDDDDDEDVFIFRKPKRRKK